MTSVAETVVVVKHDRPAPHGGVKTKRPAHVNRPELTFGIVRNEDEKAALGNSTRHIS